jgi:hypothetical protein
MGYINRSANPKQGRAWNEMSSRREGRRNGLCVLARNEPGDRQMNPSKMTFSPNALQRPHTRLALFRQAGDI